MVFDFKTLVWGTMTTNGVKKKSNIQVISIVSIRTGNGFIEFEPGLETVQPRILNRYNAK